MCIPLQWCHKERHQILLHHFPQHHNRFLMLIKHPHSWKTPLHPYHHQLQFQEDQNYLLSLNQVGIPKHQQMLQHGKVQLANGLHLLILIHKDIHSTQCHKVVLVAVVDLQVAMDGDNNKNLLKVKKDHATKLESSMSQHKRQYNSNQWFQQ